MARIGLDEFLASGHRNALIAWSLVGVATLSWIGGFLVAGALWSVFALVVVVLAVLPPLVYRSRFVMLPWEVLALAVLPLLGIALGAPRLSGPLVTYLAIAAVGFVVVVELHAFTAMRMSPGFAIVLVVAATMAAAATWELLQWYAAVILERTYGMTNSELMVEFLYATVAGFGAGILFRAYVRRRIAIADRLPREIREDVLGGEGR